MQAADKPPGAAAVEGEATITCWSASGEARDVTVPLSYSVADLSGELHRLGLTATLEARLVDPERPLSVLPSCKSLAEAGVADGGVVVALVDTPCVVQDPPPPRKVDPDDIAILTSLVTPRDPAEDGGPGDDGPAVGGRHPPRDYQMLLLNLVRQLLKLCRTVQTALGGPAPAPKHKAEDDGPGTPSVDPKALSSLTEMGFPEVRATKALILNRMSLPLAMDWLFAHEGDPDIDEPLPALPAAPQGGDSASDFTADIVEYHRLRDMGFPDEETLAALELAQNDFNTACKWLVGGFGVPASEGLAQQRQRQDDPDDPVLQAVLREADVQQRLSSARVLQALEIIERDPATARRFLHDPEVAPLLLAVSRVFADSDAVSAR